MVEREKTHKKLQMYICFAEPTQKYLMLASQKLLRKLLN